MNRDHRLLPRTLALLLGLVLLLASGFAAQRTLHVCRHAQRAEAATFDSGPRPCCAAATKAVEHHDCCAHGTADCGAGDAEGSASEPPANPTNQSAVGCSGGCCFAVDIDLENGPLPRALDLDVDAPLLAVLPIALPTPLASVVRATAHPFGTGPPGPDRRTALRRAIQLLI